MYKLIKLFIVKHFFLLRVRVKVRSGISKRLPAQDVIIEGECVWDARAHTWDYKDELSTLISRGWTPRWCSKVIYVPDMSRCRRWHSTWGQPGVMTSLSNIASGLLGDTEVKSVFFFGGTSGLPQILNGLTSSTHGVPRSSEEVTTAPSTDILMLPKVKNLFMLYSNFPLNAIQQDAKGEREVW